jgi:hypothetical protein
MGGRVLFVFFMRQAYRLHRPPVYPVGDNLTSPPKNQSKRKIASIECTERTFLNHYREQILACDFFTVETLTLKTLHVLSYFEHATRRVYLVGCTAHPNKVWVIQQARQTAWQLEDREKPI